MSVPLSLSALRNLLEYQSKQGGGLDLADLVDIAICEWLERQRDPSEHAPKGYMWKSVFLPDGARLRISSQRCVHHATIVGDELIYNSLSMSPNQFAKASLGTVRNAWEVIYVQLPAENEWKPAARLRYAAAAQAKRQARNWESATVEVKC